MPGVQGEDLTVAASIPSEDLETPASPMKGNGKRRSSITAKSQSNTPLPNGEEVGDENPDLSDNVEEQPAGAQHTPIEMGKGETTWLIDDDENVGSSSLVIMSPGPPPTTTDSSPSLVGSSKNGTESDKTLYLKEADREKLLLVLRTIAPRGLMDRPFLTVPDPFELSSPPHPKRTTLAKMLAPQQDVKLSQLKTFILQMLYDTSLKMSDRPFDLSDHSARTGFIEMVLDLLTQIENKYVAVTSRQVLPSPPLDNALVTNESLRQSSDFNRDFQPSKRANEDDGHRRGPAAKKFMLHRTLPTMDLFTSSATLTNADLERLSSIEDTDLVELMDTPVVCSVPRLRDVNLPVPPSTTTTSRKAQARPTATTSSQSARLTPVTFLYYDPFASSLGPSYDSTGSTSTYHQSVMNRMSKARLRQWGNDVMSLDPVASTADNTTTNATDVDEEKDPIALANSVPPPIPFESSTSSSTLTVVENNIVENGVGGVDNSSLHHHNSQVVASEEKVWEVMARNAEWLGILVRAQWERMRKSSATTTGSEDDRKKEDAIGNGSRTEEEASRHLIESLAILTAAVWKTPSSPRPSILPPLPVLQKNILRISTALGKEPAYFGNLDPLNQKALGDTFMLRQEEVSEEDIAPDEMPSETKAVIQAKEETGPDKEVAVET